MDFELTLSLKVILNEQNKSNRMSTQLTTDKNIKDGLWRVETNYLCAGFIVEEGKIKYCAPI